MKSLNVELLSLPKKRELLGLLSEKKYRDSRRQLFKYYPDEGPLRRELYQKHLAFFKAGTKERERAMIAANRVGKTEGVGGYEVALHATGKYPDWWDGRRWSRAVNILCAGDTGTTTRDIIQRKLLGPPGSFGTGLIPADCIIKTTAKAGIPEAVDTIHVRHESGGTTIIQLRSYDQGRKAFQGTERDIIWLDEEPKSDVYVECLYRTTTTGGIVIATFTPLNGISDVVLMYLPELGSEDGVEPKWSICVGWDDVPHIDEATKKELLAATPVHEREARTKGTPSLGSGRVFPVSEESITCNPFDIPESWTQITGLDFGWDHPTAATRCAWDRDNDVFYVCAVYAARETTPVLNAAAIKAWGDWIPVAWPHDGLQHDKGSGIQLKEQYEQQGLSMLNDKATFEDGSNGVEAGIMEMLDRMQTGRFKVFSTCQEWFQEFRMYHRKDGQISKLKDDRICASRYALMMKRFAITKPQLRRIVRRPTGASWQSL